MIKNLVYLAVFTFVIILSWIGFGIYHNYTTSTISGDTGILISPIPAHFNLEVVRRISNRQVIPADLSSTTPIASGAAKISPTTTPAPITSVSPTPIPASAQSGIPATSSPILNLPSGVPNPLGPNL